LGLFVKNATVECSMPVVTVPLPVSASVGEQPAVPCDAQDETPAEAS